MRQNTYIIGLALALLLTSSCKVGPNYTEPQIDLPDHWHNQTSSQLKEIETWWKEFNDDQLNELVDQALKQNLDIKVAEARIREARASRQQVASGLFPQISATAFTNRSNEQTAQLKGQNPASRARAYNSSEATFIANWELDIFGGTRRQVEAQNATIEQYEATLRGVRLILVADVTQEYITWRQLQLQTEIFQKIAITQEKLLDITARKFKAGLAGSFDIAQADLTYQSIVAYLPEIKRQKEASGYRLSVLIGEPAGALNLKLAKLKPLPKPIDIPALQAPAEIIRNRPDVKTAERILAANTAMQGAAIANAFPQISLSGLFGVLDTSLSSPNKVWTVASGVAMPLLTFGNIEGQINAADAIQEQSLHSYKQVILQAISEIETSLQNVSQANAQVFRLANAAKSASEAEKFALTRFKHGTSSRTEVLNIEELNLNAENNLIIAEANRLIYLVDLFKALGIFPAQGK